MHAYEIKTLENPVSATIDIPGSKSYTNRALILAALVKGPITLSNPLYSEDTEAMISCLITLGLNITTSQDAIIVHDDISSIADRFYELFTKDSGTTLRFLLALICLTPGTKVIKGSAQLNQRPIKDLVDALRHLGAKIDYMEAEGRAPLKIHSSTLSQASDVTIDPSVSSQFLSALLLISPLLDGLKIHLSNELISAPYVTMTIQTMREWGVNVIEADKLIYNIPSNQKYLMKDYLIEGDYSSAGYFFAIAALTKSSITLKNLAPISAQADRKFLEILISMGNEIQVNEQGITFIGKQIIPLSIDMKDCPDQVQTLAVLAAFAKGITTIKGVRSLRLKETERVIALKNELAKMGITTKDSHDTLIIYGGEPHAATIDTYGDHRMAMSFAVAGTKLPNMMINHPEVVNKTFPSFWDQLRSL